MWLQNHLSKLLSTPYQSTMGYTQAHKMNNHVHVFEYYIYDRIHTLVLFKSYTFYKKYSDE